jgi:hypothetical protein
VKHPEKLFRALEGRLKQHHVVYFSGSYHPTLWPRSLPECLAIAAFLNALNEQSADQHLLEMSEAELAIIERVCIEKGIGYDELIAEAVMDLYRKGDLQEQDVKDEDPADWWKNA